MEVIGFVVFSTSSDAADTKSKVKRSLHSKPNLKEGPLVYGRGDAEICGQFLRCGATENNAVGS